VSETAQICILALLVGVGVYAVLQGYRTWRNPAGPDGLGLRWYLSLGRGASRDGQPPSPELLRALGLASMILGLVGVVGIVLILVLG
jgi:hypothetical protein